MSDFVQLQQVKDILGVVDSSDDARLEAILDSTLDSVFAKIGDITKGEKTEKISKKTRLVKDGFLPLSYINVESIKSIDGVDFTNKMEGSDYLLLDNGMVQVQNLISYITTDFDYFEVVYVAGYEEAPADFVNTIANLVGLEFSKDMGKDITEETAGPRTVRYSDGGNSGDISKKNLYASLRKYIPIHLRVY